jgi:hypothetical protein
MKAEPTLIVADRKRFAGRSKGLTLEKTGSSLRQRRIKKQRHENIYSKEREEKMSSHKPMVLIDAPSNLGLRPPVPGAVPGVYKLAGALRDQGLLPWLGARDGGVVIPPRYLPDWDGHTVRNGSALATYSQRLADRVQQHCAAGECPLVLSGDCSILLGPMLALVTGREGPELANLEGRGPLVQDSDVVAIGFRSDDASAPEVQQTAMTTFSVAQLQQDGPSSVGVLGGTNTKKGKYAKTLCLRIYLVAKRSHLRAVCQWDATTPICYRRRRGMVELAGYLHQFFLPGATGPSPSPQISQSDTSHSGDG